MLKIKKPGKRGIAEIKFPNNRKIPKPLSQIDLVGCDLIQGPGQMAKANKNKPLNP